MSYKTTIQPSTEPVTLAQAKFQCRVDFDDENNDAYITSLIKPARQAAEHRTNRALMTQTVQLVLPAFPCGDFALPVSPVQSITSIVYLDASGASQTLAGSVYALDNTGEGINYVRLKNGQHWPSTLDQFNAVTVTFVAGWASADEVPATVKQWILMAIHTMYENRGSVGMTQVYELPGHFCQSLLDTVKVWGL